MLTVLIDSPEPAQRFAAIPLGVLLPDRRPKTGRARGQAHTPGPKPGPPVAISMGAGAIGGRWAPAEASPTPV